MDEAAEPRSVPDPTMPNGLRGYRRRVRREKSVGPGVADKRCPAGLPGYSSLLEVAIALADMVPARAPRVRLLLPALPAGRDPRTDRLAGRADRLILAALHPCCPIGMVKDGKSRS